LKRDLRRKQGTEINAEDTAICVTSVRWHTTTKFRKKLQAMLMGSAQILYIKFTGALGTVLTKHLNTLGKATWELIVPSGLSTRDLDCLGKGCLGSDEQLLTR
jgi:hypothetical protein